MDSQSPSLPAAGPGEIHAPPFESGHQPEQSFSIQPTPDWVLEHEVAWDSPNLHGEHALFLLADTQNSPLRKTNYERAVRRINTLEAVQKLSHIEIDYDPKITHLEVHEVRLWRDGQFQSFADRRRFIFRQREAGLETQILHGRVSAIVVLDDVRPGDILDFSYSLVTVHELEGRKIDYAFLLERAWRTVDWYVSLHLPKDELPEYRQSDGNRQEPEVYERGEEFIWVWRGRQEEVLPEEGGIPIWEPVLRWAQVSGYKSWKEVSDLLGQNWAPIAERDEETRAWVLGMEAEGRPVEDRILGAIRWVQDRIRYQGLEMGLGSILPSSPDGVLKRRYGDCKDKSLLLCKVLQALGVEAKPLLVHTVYRGAIKDHLPGFLSFNHAIVTFVVDGKRGFADPTALGAGGDAFSQCLPHYEKGLCIGDDDLISIPHVSKERSAWLIDEEFFLNRPGSQSEMVQRVEATGFEADVVRARLALSERKGYARNEAKDLQRFFADIQTWGPVLVSDDRDNNQILVETRYRFKEWGQDIDANLRMFNYNARWVAQFLACPVSHPERRRNFMLRYPLNIRHEVVVHGSLSPTSPEDHFVESLWFRARTEVNWEKNKVARLSYSHQITEKMVEAGRVPDYLKKFNVMAQSFGCQVRVKKKSSPHPVTALPEDQQEGGEVDFLPRLPVEGAKDVPRWFDATGRQKIKRKMDEFKIPAKTGWWIWVVLVVLVGNIARFAQDTTPLPKVHSNPPQTSAKWVQPQSEFQVEPQPEVRPSPIQEQIVAPIQEQAVAPAREQVVAPIREQAIIPRNVVPLDDPDMARGEAAMRKGDWETAIACLNRLEKEHSQHPSVLLLRSSVEMAQGKTASARASAEAALKLYPGQPIGLYVMGQAYMREQNWLEAEKYFRQLSQLLPTMMEGWQGLAFVYFSEGRVDEAEKAARKALDITPTHFENLKFAMFLAMSRHDTVTAAKLMDTALQRDPANPELHALQSGFFFDLGDYPSALAAVEKALEIRPGIPGFIAQRAKILAKLGREDEAYELAKTSVEVATNDRGVNEAAGMVFSFCKKFPEAIAAFTRCTELAPNDPNAWNSLGYAFILSGDQAKAREALEKSVSIQPRLRVSWENLLAVSKQMQDEERVRQCEEKLAELKAIGF